MLSAAVEKQTRLSVKRGQSVAIDEAVAVQELRDQIYQDDMAAVVFFCSSRYDRDLLGKAIDEAFPVPVMGCTTAGEIGPMGYLEGSLVGFSLASEELEVLPYCLRGLQDVDPASYEEIRESVSAHLDRAKKTQPDTSAFALFLVDGLSIMEEQIVATLHNVLGGMPLVGGSAGDDALFEQTYVYFEGEFLTDSAVAAVFMTTLPFQTFKTQHFIPTEKKLVITEADPSNRIVSEIDGKPAAWEYARILGLEIDELRPMVFSKYPVMLKIGGEYYVRSIQKVNPDGSLTFFCAIDEGLVLTLCEGVNLVDNLEQALEAATANTENPQLIIGCECILRRLEVLEKGLTEEVGGLFAKYNVMGFHTYGEQYDLIHVNQTLTAVVIGG